MSFVRPLIGAAAATLAVFLATGPTAAEPSAAPVPRLVVERPEFDAGKVTPGDVLRVEFTLRNEGQAPLTILDVKKDCGCLVPRFDDVIEPGQVGHVRVTLRTDGFQGPIEKHVYIETDDPKLAAVSLTIKALLPRSVEVTPGNEVSLLVTRGQAASVDVTLQATDELPLDVESFESSLPYLTAAVAPGAAKSGRQVKLRLTVAADTPSDTFEGEVVVETGHTRMPRLTLKVFGQPAVGVTVRPARLTFGRIRPSDKEPVERVLSLSRVRGSFKVLKVEDSLGCLRAVVLPAVAGDPVEIKVTYTGGWTNEKTHGVLRILTDDAARPTIEVAYTADVW